MDDARALLKLLELCQAPTPSKSAPELEAYQSNIRAGLVQQVTGFVV